jgi:hypothetical protein
MDFLASILLKIKRLALPNDCEVCRKITTAFKSSGRAYYYETLGSTIDLLASACKEHVPLVRYFVEKCELDGLRYSTIIGVTRAQQSTSICLFVEPPTEDDPVDRRCSMLLEVMQKAGFKRSKYGFGKTLDPEWIESQRFSEWYGRCKAHHRLTCSSPPYLALLPTPDPQYFVDTVDKCLVPAKSGVPYVALSYVCGQGDWLKTTVENVDVLQKPGELVSGRHEDLPKTVYDALNLLSILGERYLWVESLCAVDKPLPPAQRQFRTTSIFAHAELVIVAADDLNEEHGLRGIKELPEALPRKLTQSIIPFGDEELLARNFQGDNNILKKSKYINMGSTFEEYMYARRRLVFQRNSAVYECRKSTAFEELDRVREDASWDCRYIEFMFENGFPSLTVYLNLVNLINTREFALPNDVLSTFAGTLSILRQPMPGGFLHGLPEMFFDVALLWHPEKEVTRRRSVVGYAAPPSWSWAAWHGPLDCWSWASGSDFSASSRGLIAKSKTRTVPITTWHAGGVTEGERRVIDVQWAAWRERYRDEKGPLPPGWSRKKRDPESRRDAFDGHTAYGFDKYLYRHMSNPYEYYFPVPLTDPNPPEKPFPDARYLFGRVPTTTFRARLVDDDATLCLSLVNAQGQWAGGLRLHNLLDKPPIGDELEMVAISKGDLPNKGHHPLTYLERFEEPLRVVEGERYEFYNVLWVKWINGIAYRNGLGRVFKAAWDCQQPEEIDLILG